MKLSIIVATYNSEPNIYNCLTSIVGQTCNDVEILIIDGGSNDKTLEITRLFNEKHKNIHILSEQDKGIYDALNKGIRMATGEIIGFLHSDDEFFSKSTLFEIVETFKKHEIDGLYGNLNYVHRKDSNRIIRKWRSRSFKIKMLKMGWMPAHPTLFLKRGVYDKHGLYDLTFSISADYDFIIRVFKDKSLRIEHLSKVITNMRVGGASNKNLKNIFIKMKEDYYIIRKNNIGGLITLVLKNISKLNQF